MASRKTPKKTIQKKTRVSKATVKRGKQTRVSRIPSPQMHTDTRIQTRTRSRTRPPIDPDFGGALGTRPILLIGSSQIERWNLCKTWTHCINAGVGGMKTSELFRTSFLKSLPEPPIRDIVFYCGSVDIMRSRKSNHKIYQTIITNVNRFLNMMLEKYPEATIKLIGIIQTPRLSLDKDRVRLMNSVNATWQRQYRAHARVVFVNVNPRLTNPKCFMEDGVHLSEYGYMHL